MQSRNSDIIMTVKIDLKKWETFSDISKKLITAILKRFKVKEGRTPIYINKKALPDPWKTITLTF